ncbi:membrane protein required for colicin V production [Thermotomaculum hydrothermale]|uniref:Membrane protein required for colicin V production n=1 Tax=Thermotomaculum hydrothermale TaxID=981385 RepID=A0A7R6PUN6_9BACT|nr:CvpA family protein [Thermotomaculum hydrothermale]BBB33012.1 membrane protein required for colicin V production [Thermotomaculum hydrothermale]
MNWIDIAVITIIIASGVFAFFKGFIREAFSIIGLIVATVLSFRFYRPFSIYLKSIIAAKPLREFITFLLIFFILLGIVALVSYLAKKLFQKAGLTFYDKLLGLLFGLVRGLLIAYVLVLIIETTNIAPKDLKNSKTYYAVKKTASLFIDKGTKVYKRIKK